MYVRSSWPLKFTLPGSGGSSQCSLEKEQKKLQEVVFPNSRMKPLQKP